MKMNVRKFAKTLLELKQEGKEVAFQDWTRNTQEFTKLIIDGKERGNYNQFRMKFVKDYYNVFCK